MQIANRDSSTSAETYSVSLLKKSSGVGFLSFFIFATYAQQLSVYEISPTASKPSRSGRINSVPFHGVPSFTGG